MPLAVPMPRLPSHVLAAVVGALLAVGSASAQPVATAGALPPGPVGPAVHAVPPVTAVPPAAAVPTSPLSPHPQVWSTTAREPAVVQGGTWGPAYVVEPPAYGGLSVYVPAWGGRPPPPGTPGGGHPPGAPGAGHRPGKPGAAHPAPRSGAGAPAGPPPHFAGAAR
jgi:hypothetical protein